MNSGFSICFCNIILFNVISGAIVASGFVYRSSYVVYNCSSYVSHNLYPYFVIYRFAVSDNGPNTHMS